jgi:hypothetical protein
MTAAVVVSLLCNCHVALADDSGPSLAWKELGELMGGVDSRKGMAELIKRGDTMFPLYLKVLADPKTEAIYISRIFELLYELKECDRKGFIEPTLRHMVDSSHPGHDKVVTNVKGGRMPLQNFTAVRREGARLLGQIGNPAEASVLVALLSDRNDDVVRRAAEALAKIGGPREVIAMDVWLQSPPPERDPNTLREFVKKQRDELATRLEKEAAEKKKAEPPKK